MVRPEEHFDVLVIGAGLSGIGAGHFLQAECPWATYAILESRQSLGGTWDLFRYPGVRSDSDMFTLGYSWRPWDGDKTIADGRSILRYLQGVAAEEGIDRKVRFGHRATSATWDDADAVWLVRVERAAAPDADAAAARSETVVLTCRFLSICTGYYRYDRGHLPQLPGADRFTGTVVHPQAWPEDLDCTGKKIAVIGSGATAVTLVPALAEVANRVSMIQRSPSYVLSLPARDAVADAVRRVLPRRAGNWVLRWYKALTAQAFYDLSRRRPAWVKRLLGRQTARLLPAGFDVGTHFAPRYKPWDQRLCIAPDGDFFAAVRRGAAEVITDRVVGLTKTGVMVSSGRCIAADVVVTATGLDLLFAGGMEIRVGDRLLDPGETLTYRGMMLEGIPNLAVTLGYANASWTLKSDLTARYVCRVLNHMRRTGTRRCVPVNSGGDRPARPYIGLTSGYVLRSADRFPKQGSLAPWLVQQSYVRDYRSLRLGRVDDRTLRFSHPGPWIRPAQPVTGGAVQVGS